MENNFQSPLNSSSTEKSIRSGEFDSSTLSNPSTADHATLFAAPSPNTGNQPSFSSAEVGITPATKSKFPIVIFLAAPLFLALVGGVVFALFNVDALCEPLGLCDKEETEDGSDMTEGTEKRGGSDDQVPGSKRTDPLKSSPQVPDRRTVPPVVPPTQSTQTQPNMLPDREEALW